MIGAADDRLPVVFHEATEHSALRVFVAVAEERSFSRAADRLYLAQPWLSTQVRNLEARIGLRLFERSSHHVELTAAAAALLPLAKDLLQSLDDAVAAAKRAIGDAPPPGNLRLGAPTYTVFLTSRVQALERFEQARPAAEIAIDSDNTVELEHRLRRGRLDAAFLLAPICEDGLRVLPFARPPRQLQIPADHPLARLDVVGLADLTGHRVATWRPEVHVQAWERIFGPMRDAGAELVPMEGLVVDGIAEAAASLGLISLAGIETRPLAGVVRRPVEGLATATILLAAGADGEGWSDELRCFWAIAEELAGVPDEQA